MTGWRNLDGLQRCQVHPGFTEQQAVRAKRSSKKRQTKPIKISHKSLALKELTSDRFGLLYAKRTQFRVVEAATLEDWRCRKPARRQAWPTLDRGPDWRGMGSADAETGQRVSRRCRRKSGEWRVAYGGWRRPNGG